MTDQDLVCVYTTNDHGNLELGLLQVVLESKGIEVVRHGGEGSPVGIPLLPTDAPRGELFVPATSEQDARRVIEQWRASRDDFQPELPTWDCSACGEENATSFEFCWQCGKER